MKREDVSLLLPWNANGTLDTDEATIVDKQLADDNELAKEFDLILEDMAATQELAEEEEVPASMPLRFQTAVEKLVTAPEKAVAKQTDWSLASRLQQLFDFVMPREMLAYATAAALLLVAVQGGVIATLLNNSSGDVGQYQTASDKRKGATGAKSGTVYLVELSKAASVGDIITFLNDKGGKIIEGPLPGNLFRIRFAPNNGKTNQDLEKKLRGKSDMFVNVYPEY